LESRREYIIGEVRAKELAIQHLDQVKARGKLVRDWSIGDDILSIGLTTRRGHSHTRPSVSRREAKAARR
jgi:hypothetical protein